MSYSVAEKNASIYNLLVLINKLSHVLSLLIHSGEPEDIVDEGNILNSYHSTVIIQTSKLCANDMFSELPPFAFIIVIIIIIIIIIIICFCIYPLECA